MDEISRRINEKPSLGRHDINHEAPSYKQGISSLHESDFCDLNLSDENSPDISNQRTLRFSDIMIAYERMQKARISRKSLPSDNTRLTYSASIEALKNHDKHEDGHKCPFRGFDAIKDDLSKSTYYVRRSALIDHAMSILQEHTKSILKQNKPFLFGRKR